MASYNRVILIGNVTRDPELKYTEKGTSVVELGIAVHDRRKGKDSRWIEETTFLDVTLWAGQAEVAANFLRKGSPALIEGRLNLDAWEQEGQKRSKLRVIGERMQMLAAYVKPGDDPPAVDTSSQCMSIAEQIESGGAEIPF